MNCKIISISPESIDNVQDFGHKSDDFGKIRYKKRRQNILNFLSGYKNDNLNIELFDAVTPNKFSIVGDKVLFENKFYNIWNSILYTANTFSHLKILEMDEDTLILEDDIFLDEDKFNKIPELVESFSKIPDENKVLYLQLSVPWIENAPEKKLNIIENTTEKIGLSSIIDFSGTAAYFIKKECKKFIVDNIAGHTLGKLNSSKSLMCVDGAFDKYMNILNERSIIKYYIPRDKNDMFTLDTKTNWL